MLHSGEVLYLSSSVQNVAITHRSSFVTRVASVAEITRGTLEHNREDSAFLSQFCVLPLK